MKRVAMCILLTGLLAVSCSYGPRAVAEGKVIYAIDYPDHKDNFFLYSILPKGMAVNFRDGLMESRIRKANPENVLLVDCNHRKVSAYFQYGSEVFNAVLSSADVKKMVVQSLRKVPGFLLAYAIDRYGIRMEFRAKNFEECSSTKEQLRFEKNGFLILYSEYNEKLGGSLQSFE